MSYSRVYQVQIRKSSSLKDLHREGGIGGLSDGSTLGPGGVESVSRVGSMLFFKGCRFSLFMPSPSFMYDSCCCVLELLVVFIYFLSSGGLVKI